MYLEKLSDSQFEARKALKLFTQKWSSTVFTEGTILYTPPNSSKESTVKDGNEGPGGRGRDAPGPAGPGGVRAR